MRTFARTFLKTFSNNSGVLRATFWLVVCAVAIFSSFAALAQEVKARRDSANILISGQRESVVTTRPKRELPGYEWLFGLYAAGAWQRHLANFAYLNGMEPIVAPPELSYGALETPGIGLGMAIDKRFSTMFQAQLRLGANLSAPEFALRHNIGLDENYDTVFALHRLRTSLITLSVAPAMSVRLLERLFFSLGAEAQYIVASQYSYADSLFPRRAASGAPFQSRSQEGTIAEPLLALGAFAGVEWYIPLSRTTFLTPFLRYHIPLTGLAGVSSGGQTIERGVPALRETFPVVAGDWRVGALQFGVSYQWGEGSVNPIIRETVYERDTSTAIVEGGRERLRLQSSERGVITSEENGLLVERTIIHESYVREVPKASALKADIRVTGVDWDGARQPSPTIVAEEFESETYHPLLPYVFFGAASADLLQTRQTLLRSAKASAAWKEDSMPNDPLRIHAQLLNVIGARMKAYPQARLVVTGCLSNVGAERNNTELSMQRAKAVQNYLATVWGIKPDRIRVQARTLPEKPSLGDNEDAAAENRRVEISASIPEILAPVRVRSLTRTITPPSLELKTSIDAPAGIRSWTIALQRNGSTLQQWTGESVTGEAPPPQLWRLSDEFVGASEIPIVASVRVADLDRREVAAADSITVRQITVRKKRMEKVGDVALERFSLMLFDFDRAEINADNLPLLSFIKGRVRNDSRVTIIGYGDRVGSKEYNRDLAFRRSSEVKKFFQLPEDVVKIIPIGNDVLLHDNATPEGRSYCRIVQVVIATPIQR